MRSFRQRQKNYYDNEQDYAEHNPLLGIPDNNPLDFNNMKSKMKYLEMKKEKKTATDRNLKLLEEISEWIDYTLKDMNEEYVSFDDYKLLKISNTNKDIETQDKIKEWTNFLSKYKNIYSIGIKEFLIAKKYFQNKYEEYFKNYTK